MAFALPLLIATNANVQAAYRPMPATAHTITVGDWTRSATGTWAGMKDGVTYWYKLDKKAGLWWSTDGKKWADVKDGAWADKEGKWLKIHDKNWYGALMVKHGPKYLNGNGKAPMVSGTSSIDIGLCG
ncbi:hypothetical protein [Paraflavitalea speifideaquila]|uniref:hypothetical protein n=1 Tax=Paraflavitalea speifideaquila TaxID=3076558 RepID=UPI0028EBE2E2|nr:hypothetical protein [Paraflavitalea speifideiaquila]